MTYQGLNKSRAGVKAAMNVHAKNMSIIEQRRKVQERRTREKLLKEQAPKNPIKRALYYAEGRKQLKKRGL